MRRWRIVAGVEACQNLQRKDTPMTVNTRIIPFRQPRSIIVSLTEIARDWVHRIPMAALEAQADGFFTMVSEDPLAVGRQCIDRHGAGPERVIQMGSGRSRSGFTRCVIGWRMCRPRRRFPSRPTSCRSGRGARKSFDAHLPVHYLRVNSNGHF